MTYQNRDTGRTGMDRLRRLLRMTPALLLATLPLAAQPVELQLTCRPEHGLLDRRQERPVDVRDHSSYSTYYLFDNPQLFDMRVSVINVSPSRRPVAGLASDWTGALQVRVRQDGRELGADEIRIEPVKRILRSLVYLQDGKPVSEPRFGRRPTSPGAEPLMPYDDYRHEERIVDRLPGELATYEEAIVILRLRAADGGDLPPGLYGVSVSNAANRLSCGGEQLVVMRSPGSPLDIVDAHIVRANAYQAEGELDSAASELARATELAPGVLKGWVYRSALALRRNDLAGQAEAATRLEGLLAQKAAGDPEDFEGVEQDARSVARYAPELRRRLAAQKNPRP